MFKTGKLPAVTASLAPLPQRLMAYADRHFQSTDTSV